MRDEQRSDAISWTTVPRILWIPDVVPFVYPCVPHLPQVTPHKLRRHDQPLLQGRDPQRDRTSGSREAGEQRPWGWRGVRMSTGERVRIQTAFSVLLVSACALPAHPATPLVVDLPTIVEAWSLLEDLPAYPDDTYHTDTYLRAEFGEAWVGLDPSACNTRDQVLATQLVDVVMRDNGCYVDTGTLHDPYTGSTVYFERGPDTSPLVQVDHVVSLWEAWATGADTWTFEQRVAYANDPLNLMATTESANDEKDALSIAEWAPSTANGQCDVALRVIAVKVKYQLEIRNVDREALRGLLGSCPEN